MLTTENSQKPENGKARGRVLPAVLRTLGTVILLLVIVTCLPLTVPRFFGYEVYRVLSPSMAPAIPEDSVVYVHQLAPEEVAEGDVVAFWSQGDVVTHRVLQNRVVEGNFITKGDANESEDLWPVPYYALIGRVERSIPLLGKVLVVYSGNVGKAYVLVFAACGVMLHLVAGRLRDRQRSGESEGG